MESDEYLIVGDIGGTNFRLRLSKIITIPTTI